MDDFDHLDIEVIKISKIEADRGGLKGFAAVKVGPVIIYRWRIVFRDGKAWVAYPQFGKNFPTIKMPMGLKEKIEKTVLEFLNKENI